MVLDKVSRILLTRTDSIGDVLLSTPAIQALREKFSDAFIAILVIPYSEPIVRHNPYLDEVIVYDKYGKHHSYINTFLFAIKLRKKKFDLCIALHPTNRVHIMSFIAGIPVRIGYDNKLKFLLTHPISHSKQFGAKHEFEYTLDMLKLLDIKPKKYPITLNVPGKITNKIYNILSSRNLSDARLVAIQPGASCPSKIWPPDKYIELIKTLHYKFSLSVIIIGDKRSKDISNYIQQKVDFDIWNTTGKFSVLKVAALLKFCEVLISNDSGPVHISSALGTSVIAIFGRNQPGLSPKRWGPLGERDIFLHKDVGCDECLAHNCVKGFKCIKSIKVEEVLNALEKMEVL